MAHNDIEVKQLINDFLSSTFPALFAPDEPLRVANILARSGHTRREVDMLIRMCRNELVRHVDYSNAIIVRTNALLGALSDPCLIDLW